jgi:hypothetical protein
VIAGGRLIGCRSRGTGDDAPLSARSNRGAQRWLNGCTRTLPDVPQTEGESHLDKGWLSGECAEDPPLARDLESVASETRSGNSRNLPVSGAAKFDNSFGV